MAFRPPRKLPGFADLKSTLTQSKSADDPLYQVVQELIERMSSFQFEVNDALFNGLSGVPVPFYQEGNWIPALRATDGVGLTYSTQVGRFTRVGKIVHCEFDITLSTLNWTTGQIRLTGFPFPNISDLPAVGTLGFFSQALPVYGIDLYMPPGSGEVIFFAKTTLGGTTDTALAAGHIIAGSTVRGSITYLAA